MTISKSLRPMHKSYKNQAQIEEPEGKNQLFNSMNIWGPCGIPDICSLVSRKCNPMIRLYSCMTFCEGHEAELRRSLSESNATTS